jgi:hypothetical protein
LINQLNFISSFIHFIFTSLKSEEVLKKNNCGYQYHWIIQFESEKIFTGHFIWMCNIFNYKADIWKVSILNKLKSTVETVTSILDSKLNKIIIPTKNCCYQHLRNGLFKGGGHWTIQHRLKHILHYHLLLPSFGPTRNHYEIGILTCLANKTENINLILYGLSNRVLTVVE